MSNYIIALVSIESLAPLAIGFLLTKTAIVRFFYAVLGFFTFQILIGSFFMGIEPQALTYVIVSNWVSLLFVYVDYKFNLSSRLEKYSTLNNNIHFPNSGLISIFFAGMSLLMMINSMGGPQSLASNWLLVKDAVDANVASRVIAIIFFLLGSTALLVARTQRLSLWTLAVTTILLLAFCILIRVKIYFIPILVALFIPISQRLNLYRFLIFAILFVFSYLLIMIARWLGDFSEVSWSKLIEVMASVLSVGIEREAYHQYISVFDYYLERDKPWFATLHRIIMVPIDKVFGTSFAPENPMYFFSTISFGMTINPGGSAHPTIYGDSFAQAGAFGVVWPLISCILVTVLLAQKMNLYSRAMSQILVYFSFALILRGSSFYGLMYLMPLVILSLSALAFSFFKKGE